jgi:hypothetical protein
MKTAFAAFLLISLSFPGWTLPAVAADTVPDAAKAEKIGAVALQTKLGEYTYTKYMQTLSWAAMKQGDDYWLAMPVLQPQATPDLNQLPGWIVQIDRHDGHVIGVYLQY